MFSSNRPICLQEGTALVFSLLILLIMTIIGVAALSNTQMQERMSGNVNVQSIAFEAASAGISEALDYGMAEWDARGCDRVDGAWDPPGTYNDPATLDLATGLAAAEQNLTIQYRLKADCLEDPGFDDASDPLFRPPVQMYVTSQGIVSANGDELATREIEVRIDDFRADSLSALRIEGDATLVFDPANSRNFIVDGSGGAAVSSSSLANATTIVEEIDDVDRLGNYKGGVARTDYDTPFNSASQLARFALEIRAFLQSKEERRANPLSTAPNAADCNAVTFTEEEEAAFAEFIDVFGEPYTPELRFIDGDFNINGGTDFDGLTYVTGNLTMSGNPSGSGLIIVEGTVQWAGTAEFQGFVLALGGEFVIQGAGRGETVGMIYVADIALPNLTEGGVYEDLTDAWAGEEWLWVLGEFDGWRDPADLSDFADGALIDTDHPLPDGFGDTLVDVSGGGNHTVTYSCAMIDGFRRVLSECGIEDHTRIDDLENVGLAEPWADLGCGIPGRGGSIQAIRSWRENLGWRELLDAS